MPGKIFGDACLFQTTTSPSGGTARARRRHGAMRAGVSGVQRNHLLAKRMPVPSSAPTHATTTSRVLVADVEGGIQRSGIRDQLKSIG
jgi:hypothetical protein